MKADDLMLEELIEFSDGNVNLKQRRLIVHDVNALFQFRIDLVGMLGVHQMRRLLTRYGSFWGQADASAMQRVFEWDSPEEWIRAGTRLLSLQGMGRCAITSLAMDGGVGSFKMAITMYNTVEAEEYLTNSGQTEHAVCYMMMGYLSGYMSFCMNRNIYFIEEACRAKGDPACSSLGMEREPWGSRLEGNLPYFEFDDIRGKITSLQNELEEKTREMAKQRRHIAVLRRKKKRYYLEVHSAAYRRVLESAERVAGFNTSILITGETGTGKEVLARFIHQNSNRSSGPFVAINCSALPETLLESELFGHKAGAFTGAISDREGLFEHANNGTLFLDEIGDISPAMQVKLLRVLQNHQIQRLGENAPISINVRIIAATNKNLEEALQKLLFREDFYYRLGVVTIQVPPLRERQADILPLARYFIKRFARQNKMPNLRLDPDCLDLMTQYHWPGNIRELENAIEHAAVMSPEQVIRAEYFPSSILRPRQSISTLLEQANRPLAYIEKNYIQAVLSASGNNKSQTAKILGISQATLWRKLKEYAAES